MMKRWTRVGLVLLAASAGVAWLRGAESAAERGKKLLLGRSYSPPTMALSAYDNAWRHWGLKARPPAGDYDRLFRQRYGLHPAPYPNHGLPMGLRRDTVSLGLVKRQGLTVDCLICHGGSIAGTSYVGLGNASLDYQAFYEEMAGAEGRRVRPPFTFCNVRGTSEAGGMSVFLLGYRQPDLKLRLSRLDLDLHDDLCEDVPAWWLLKKKKTMYHAGSMDTRSVRSLMQFMMGPLNFPADIKKAEGDFKDIRAYLLSLEPPKYPLPIDRALASRGKGLFKSHCSRCHGSYGSEWTYPNKVVPLEEIGTDRHRYDGITRKFAAYYDRSWFAAHYKIRATAGYQAPPLDGIWATAPYLHNGSVPTVYHLLNSKTRPKVFTRSYATDLAAYDAKKLGWKVQVLDRAPDPKTTPPLELRKVYDTTRPGRGNGGHTFGDKLTEAERLAVIEYLKTL
jgi:mono/diheme cytochrome c family protein